MPKIDQIEIQGTSYEIVPEVAPLFNENTVYSAGEYVIKDAVLYRFTSDHSAGEWVGSDAVATVLGDEVKKIKASAMPMDTTVNIPEYADLDDYTVPGVYASRSVAVSTTILHKPNDKGYSFDLYVSKVVGSTTTGKYLRQIFIDISNTNRTDVYMRTMTSLDYWGTWHQFAYMDDINSLQSQIDPYLVSASYEEGWTKGSYSSINGNPLATDIAIRNNDLRSFQTGTLKFQTETGYVARLFAWDSEGTFVGSYKTSGQFTTDADGLTSVTSFDFSRFPNYYIKVVILRSSSSSEIDPSEGSMVHFIRTTDETLTEHGKAADADSVRQVLKTKISNEHKSASGNPIVINTTNNSDYFSAFKLSNFIVDVEEDPSPSEPNIFDPIDKVLISIKNGNYSSQVGYKLPSDIYGGTLDLLADTLTPAIHYALSIDNLDILSFNETYSQLRIVNAIGVTAQEQSSIICTHYLTYTGAFANLPNNKLMISGRTIAIKDPLLTSLESWKQFITDQYNAGTPVEIVYFSSNAVPTSITTEEAFAPSLIPGRNIVSAKNGMIDVEYHEVDPLKKFVEKKIVTKRGNNIFIASANGSVNSLVIDNLEHKPSAQPSFDNPIPLQKVPQNITVQVDVDKLHYQTVFNITGDVYGATIDALSGAMSVWEHVSLTPDLFNRLVYKNNKLYITKLINLLSADRSTLVCSHAVTVNGAFSSVIDGQATKSGRSFAIRNDNLTSLEAWKDYLTEQYNNGTPVEFVSKSIEDTIVDTGSFVSIPTDNEKAIIINCDAGELFCNVSLDDYSAGKDNSGVELTVQTEPNGTRVYISKIPKISKNGKTVVPKVACGDIEYDNDEPVYCEPLTPTDFSNILESNVVMNAGFFARQAGTNIPHGSVISNGRVLLNKTYDNTKANKALCIDARGNFSYAVSATMNAQTLRENGILQCFCAFGPIISGGVIQTAEIESHGGGSDTTMNIVGYDETNYYILTANGRKTDEPGITETRAAEILHDLGLQEAFLMDGGGSVSTVINGTKVNRDIDASGERPVSTVLYFDQIDPYLELVLNNQQ